MRSKKQAIVSRSSTEVKFQAVALGICDLLWLKMLLEELTVTGERPMKIYCDNKATIDISDNLVQHYQTKHVKVDRHFIKEKIEGAIHMSYVPTSEQTVDVLAKGLARQCLRD